MKKGMSDFAYTLCKHTRKIFAPRTWLIVVAISVVSHAGWTQEITETGSITAAEEQGVQDTADAWLAMIDDADYAKSYQQTSALLRNQMSKTVWVQKMKSIHGPLRGLVSRAPQKREFKTALPGMPKGEYIIITYGSKYLQADDVVETLVLAKADDVWQIADYAILPQ